MKNLKNKVTLTGHTGKDAEIYSFKSGKKLATLSIAVNDNYKIGGDWYEHTNWFDLVFWNAKTSLAEPIKKGTKVCIEGRLTTNSYELNGETKTSVQIIVSRIQLLEKTVPDAN